MNDGILICIVDDDPDVLDSTSLLVRALGYQTVPYSSGSDFLADLANRRPACVLIDQRMPGMLGTEVVGELRNRCCNVPVVLMSGHATVELRSKVDDLSAQLLEKPVTKDRLISVLKEAVSRRP